MAHPVFPPASDPVLFRDIVNFNLDNNPHAPFYYFSRDGSDKVTTISHLEFSRAAHRVAHIIRPNRTGEDGRVVSIIANADNIVYQAVTMGIIVAGLVVRVLDVTLKNGRYQL
ncbi:hypothetical protein PLICRDRAFT_115910 [Plicaturopsis crispa FD-325 SS-3]|nr:hypothetical protein PLICRDRAFT_115910 [Plicaturopsis crispa FD-325 SS-3]